MRFDIKKKWKIWDEFSGGGEGGGGPLTTPLIGDKNESAALGGKGKKK